MSKISKTALTVLNALVAGEAIEMKPATQKSLVKKGLIDVADDGTVTITDAGREVDGVEAPKPAPAPKRRKRSKVWTKADIDATPEVSVFETRSTPEQVIDGLTVPPLSYFAVEFTFGGGVASGDIASLCAAVSEALRAYDDAQAPAEEAADEGSDEAADEGSDED